MIIHAWFDGGGWGTNMYKRKSLMYAAGLLPPQVRRRRAYSPTRQDCGADFKSSGRTSPTDTISYALVPGPARQGDQEARQCRFLVVVGGAGWPSRAAGKPYTTRQLGSPGENARWGSGFDSPWRGGGGSPVHGLPPSSSTSCHR